MKSIDFTQPGGFPLTQERLAYMQEAYTEAITALGAVFTNGSVPVRISGMGSTPAGGGVTDVSDGFFFYNGELVRFEADSYGAPGSGNAVYVTITETALPLTYYDGSEPEVIIDKVGTIDILVNTTPEDATHFLLSSLQPAAIAFADANVDIINPPFIAPTYVGAFLPDPSSPIAFRKAHGSKRVVIKGVTYEIWPVGTTSDYPVFTLPVGYRPNEEQLFATMCPFTGPVIVRIKPDGAVSLAGDLSGVGSTLGCWMNISFDVD